MEPATIIKLLITVAVYISGAVTEYKTNGAVTKAIMYQDGNVTVVECKP